MHGKFLFLIVFFVIAYKSISSVSLAETYESFGRVNMNGAIIDTACAIEFDSREQVIDMGIIPLSSVLNDRQILSKSFSIHLINCVLERPGKPNWSQFQVTFDGERDGNYFGVYGDASGVALSIMDEFGNQALPGKALPFNDVILGDKVLNYTLILVPNQHLLKSGTYFSSIRFKLDYF